MQTSKNQHQNGVLPWFGGVFANFHEQRIRLSETLSPAAALTGIISEISLMSSLVSFTVKEPILASTFYVLVVPTTKHTRSGGQFSRFT